MDKKRGILSVYFILCFLISVSYTIAEDLDPNTEGCCISPNGCEFITREQCNLIGDYGFYPESACASIDTDLCDIGCCCDDGLANIARVQCVGNFYLDMNQESCTAQCGNIGTAPTVIVDEGVTAPEETTEVPIEDQSVSTPIEPSLPYYESFCGNNKIDFYEICDGIIDTKAEGSLVDCELQCGLPNSNNACKCPVSCSQNPVAATLQIAKPITGKKSIQLAWSFPATNCKPTNIFIERCDQQDPLLCTWYPIIGDLLENNYIDTNIKFNQIYNYRIGAFYYDESNYAVTKLSNILTVRPMDEFCVKLNSASIDDKFCDDNWEAKCNFNNQIEKIFNCDLQTNSICVAGSCQSKGLCGECAVPFGLFLLPQCQYLSCYLDYSRFNVDIYNDCGEISSCYDYKSETACENNKCGMPACEWSNSDLSEIGLGVCKPSQKEYQDCSKCNSQFNSLLGGCNSNICGLMGDECRYTSKSTCIDDTEMACIYYTTQEECTGQQNLALEINDDNSIKQASQDKLNIGTCRWEGRCIKDADENTIKDCLEDDYKCQSDNVPPITIVPKIPVSPLNIEIPFAVFDNSYDNANVITYYAIAKEWTYPTTEAINGKFSKIISESDFYILTYYSKDKSNNIEQVKSFQFYVDGEKPQVEVIYNAIPQEQNQDNWTSKVDIVIKAEDNADSLVTCSGQLLQGNVEFNSIDSLDNELIAERTIHYSDIPDGFHVFHYECNDRSGNVDAGNVLISVSGDRSLINPLPSTTLNYHQNIQLSITSAKSAECRYSDSINSFEHMSGYFTTLNNLLHTVVVEVSPIIFNNRFYVKCKLLDTGVIIGTENDEIRFTIDEKPPITKIYGALQSCSADWLHNNFELIFDCLDPAQRKVGYPTEFGCSKTFYCTGDVCNPSTEFANSIILSQTTPIRYYSIDAGGNAETIKVDEIRIDKDQPVVSINIIDTTTGMPVTDKTIKRISQEPYLIEIISSKAIEKFTEFGFVLTNNDQYNLPTPFPKSTDRKTWQTLLNPSEYTNLITQAVFQINAMAEHNWIIDKLSSTTDTFYFKTVQTNQESITTASGSITLSEVKSDGKIITQTNLNDKTVYVLENKDITLKGTVSGLESLWYYIGSEKISVPLQNNQFEFSTTVMSIESAELETNLYFIGADSLGNHYSKSFSFLIDKQGPIVSDFELENADGIMIKTPLPTVVVEYLEPVSIVDYGLRNFDVNIEIERLNDKTFRFNILDPLTNGCYKLVIKANDSNGNVALADSEIGFGIDASETKIILENPHHGSSLVANLDLKIKTTWAATCKYAYTEPDTFDHPLLLNFDTTGLLEHTKVGFTVINQQPFYVICDDGRELIKESFILTLDTNRPSIVKAVADPPVVSQQGVNSRLIVETDEQYTICKYSTASTDYSQMRYFPGESKDSPESYTKIHYKLLPFDSEPRSETYYVQCEDLSGQLSEAKSISFSVEEQALVINVLNPLRYTSERFIDLNFTTNEVANCKYKNVSGQWQTISSESREHNYPLGRFSAGSHTIDLECTTIVGLTGALSKPEIAELTYTFTIDLTKPVMLSASGGNNSCPTGKEDYSLGISFEALDNESFIKLYKFDIIDSLGSNILANQTSTSSQVNIETKLIEGTKYKIIASSLNGAGLESSTIESGYITAKSLLDPECKERNAPEIGFRIIQSAAGVNVILVCDDESGCDADSLKYGISNEPECAPINPYNQEIELSESVFFCGKACDAIGNCGTKQEKIDVLAGDLDSDGILDIADQCPDTAIGEIIDEQGCSESQRYLDLDNDGVRDQFDLCSGTPLGELVDSNGCPSSIIVPQYVSEIEEIEKESSILSLILMILGATAILGGLGYFAYVQYFMPSNVKETIPEQIIKPIKQIFIPRRKMEFSKKTGEDLFQSLEDVTKGRVFDKLSRFIKKETTSKENTFERLSRFIKREEHDVFHELEKVTQLRKTQSPGQKDVFEQLSKITSIRRATQPKQVKQLKKITKKGYK